MSLRSVVGVIASYWGLLGFLLLVGSAIYRLSAYVWELRDYELNYWHWSLMLIFLVFMLYSEGYRGFHQKLSPRFASRGKALRQMNNFWFYVAAPLFCVGYFYATRKRVITSFAITLMIVVLVMIVSRLPQPWRGIVDLGVVAGLVFGLSSVVYWWIRVELTGSCEVDTEFPEERA